MPKQCGHIISGLSCKWQNQFKHQAKWSLVQRTQSMSQESRESREWQLPFLKPESSTFLDCRVVENASELCSSLTRWGREPSSKNMVTAVVPIPSKCWPTMDRMLAPDYWKFYSLHWYGTGEPMQVPCISEWRETRDTSIVILVFGGFVLSMACWVFKNICT
jgi:hypothetical protein